MTTPSRARHGPGPRDPASTNDDAPPASTSLGPVSTDAATHHLARTGTVVCLVVILMAVLWPSSLDRKSVV